MNIFDQGLDYSGNQLFKCLKYLETRFTDLANTSEENQLKGAKQLNDPKSTDAVDFIRKKFEEYEEARRQKDEVIKALQGKVSTLHDHLA